MASGKVPMLWAQMVKARPIRMIAPPHGAPMAGPAVPQFVGWVRTLACGVDGLPQRADALPA